MLECCLQQSTFYYPNTAVSTNAASLLAQLNAARLQTTNVRVCVFSLSPHFQVNYAYNARLGTLLTNPQLQSSLLYRPVVQQPVVYPYSIANLNRG